MGPIRHSAGAALRFLQGIALYRRVARFFSPLGVTIREATNEDLLEVYHWLSPESNPEHLLTRQNLNARHWVAYWCGRISGYVDLVRHPPGDPCYAGYWLFGLHIRSFLRGTGIGEKLSLLVIERARAEGAPVLDLLVFNDNHRAIQLYRKLGFEMYTREELEEQLVKEATATGRRRVVMRKKLVEDT